MQHFNKMKEHLRAGEIVEAGFTLIELLIVIVVLGILAATVIFALGGVTGQSAVAACNSDAKSTEVAVEAFKASPDNATNTDPNSMGDLITGAGGPYLRALPTSTHYTISIVPGTGEVDVATTGHAAANYDGATNPCSTAS